MIPIDRDKSYPSPDEILNASGVLNRLIPGYQPEEIFKAICRIVATPVIEVVPLRLNVRGLEVLMLQRGSHDSYWPNMWHGPGTVLRVTDRPGTEFEDAFERILKDELKNPNLVSGPTWFESGLIGGLRGMSSYSGFWVQLDPFASPPEKGRFFRTERLPLEIIEGHAGLIDSAVRNFRSRFIRT
jgi:hypothetical protein